MRILYNFCLFLLEIFEYLVKFIHYLNRYFIVVLYRCFRFKTTNINFFKIGLKTEKKDCKIKCKILKKNIYLNSQ